MFSVMLDSSDVWSLILPYKFYPKNAVDILNFNITLCSRDYNTLAIALLIKTMVFLRRFQSFDVKQSARVYKYIQK